MPGSEDKQNKWKTIQELFVLFCYICNVHCHQTTIFALILRCNTIGKDTTAQQLDSTAAEKCHRCKSRFEISEAFEKMQVGVACILRSRSSRQSLKLVGIFSEHFISLFAVHFAFLWVSIRMLIPFVRPSAASFLVAMYSHCVVCTYIARHDFRTIYNIITSQPYFLSRKLNKLC